MREMAIGDVAAGWPDVVALNDFQRCLQEAVTHLRNRELLDVVTVDDLPSPTEGAKPTLDLREVIARDESGKVEFKSTWRWDLEKQAVSEDIEHAALKTIAAFANSKGGTLIVGVANDRSIVGLKHDYAASTGTKDRDHLERHIFNVCERHFSRSFTAACLNVEYHNLEEGDVFEIRIRASSDAVVVKRKEKNGKEREVFYVRTGNSTRELSPKDLAAYQKQRFSA